MPSGAIHPHQFEFLALYGLPPSHGILAVWRYIA
jgi:hypothetical protein